MFKKIKDWIGIGKRREHDRIVRTFLCNKAESSQNTLELIQTISKLTYYVKDPAVSRTTFRTVNKIIERRSRELKQ